MATPPPSLSLSIDSTLQPFLLNSSSSPSLSFSSASSPFFSIRRSHHIKFLRHYSSLPLTLPIKPSLQNLPAAGGFVAPDTPEKREILEKFRRRYEFERGSLEVRPMKEEELDATVKLLAESFAESMWMPPRYVPLLAFLVKQYLVERLALAPHMTVLVGFYKENGGKKEEAELACTVEISFDAIGANVATPTPLPPRECPYICNMSVKKTLRRRRIAWHLLQACEELINEMKAQNKVYLHCRVIDKAPFDMYKKCGFKIVKSDNILTWLTLQRRKHLMCKELLPVSDSISLNISHVDDHQT